MNLAVIPARGGSKRIPKKNIKDFLGKPIISYSIEAAIDCGLFDRIIVSTDCNDIAKVALKYGAEVPFIRPNELSDDYSGIHEVIRHSINWFESRGDTVDYGCCIYATAPLINVNDIIEGFKLIQTGNWDSVIAATDYPYPIFRSFEKLSSGGLRMVFPQHYNSRSQDLPDVYHDAGQFYWAKSKFLKGKPSNFNEANSIVKLPNFRVQDIDSIEDWKRAELLYQNLEIK